VCIDETYPAASLEKWICTHRDRSETLNSAGQLVIWQEVHKAIGNPTRKNRLITVGRTYSNTSEKKYMVDAKRRQDYI